MVTLAIGWLAGLLTVPLLRLVRYWFRQSRIKEDAQKRLMAIHQTYEQHNRAARSHF